ncbi:hypothetical protein BGZ93_006508 [Podila epicladia]|nr:hypothetical protein BGZ92_000867 [Podila epicladia]KAG0094976.1 hypothetical protein BGZ93_006508 [Podila epicladia]
MPDTIMALSLWKRIPQVLDGSSALDKGFHTPYGISDNGQFETGNNRRKRHQPGPSGQEKEEARRTVMSKRSLFSGIYRDNRPRGQTEVSQLQQQKQQEFGRKQEVVQRLRESWYHRPAVMGEPNVLSDGDYQGLSQGDKYTPHSNGNNDNNTPERYTPDLYDDWIEDENGEEDGVGLTIIEPHYPSLDLFEEDDGDDIGIRDGDMTVDSQIEEEEEERYRRMMSQRRQYQQQQNHPGWTVDEWEEDLETDMDELMDWIEDEDHHVVHDRKPRKQQESRDDGTLQRGYLFRF